METGAKVALVVLAVGGAAAAYWYWQRGIASGELQTVDPSAFEDSAALPSADVFRDFTGVLGLSAPLGMRLHNPGNLRYIADATRAWRGQIDQQSGFGVYQSDELGCRAMGKQLSKYYAAGLRSVEQIVSRWAPRNENDTASYINAVCQRMGVLYNSPLIFPDVLGSLMYAMIVQEQGYCPWDTATLRAWGTES